MLDNALHCAIPFLSLSFFTTYPVRYSVSTLQIVSDYDSKPAKLLKNKSWATCSRYDMVIILYVH